MRTMALRCVGFGLGVGLALVAAGYAQETTAPTDTPPPADSCVLELLLPDRATVAVDGRDYGTKRELTFQGLKPQTFYTSKVVVRFADATTEQHTVYIEGGRRIRLALAGPAAGRPELMLQTGDTYGPVAWSRDGRYILAGRILCDAASGRHLRVFPRPMSSMIAGVALSPDGRRAALVATSNPFAPSEGDYSTVYVYDTATAQLVQQLPASLSNRALQYSADGRYLAVAGEGWRMEPTTKSYSHFGEAHVYEVATGRKVRTIQHGHSFDSAVLSADGRRIFTGSGFLPSQADAGIFEWDVASGSRLRTFPDHKVAVPSLAIRADGSQLLSCSAMNNSIILWDLASATPRQVFRGAKGDVEAIAVSPDGRYLATGESNYSEPRRLILWDMRTALPAWSAAAHAEEVVALAFSVDGQRLASGDGKGTIKVWDAAAGRALHALTGPEGLHDLGFSADGENLVCMTYSKLSLLNIRTGEKLWEQEGFEHCATVSADGKTILAARRDAVAVLDLDSGGERRTLPAVGNTKVLCMTRDGRRAFTAGNNGGGRVWDVEAEKLLGFLANTKEVRSAAFSPDGTLLATGLEDHQAAVWDVATREMRFSVSGGTYHCPAAFTADGKELLCGGTGKVMSVDTRSGEPVRTFRVHDGLLFSVALSANGDRVLTAGRIETKYDPANPLELGQTVMWDAGTGRALWAYEDQGGGKRAAAFSPDGKEVVVNGPRGVVLEAATGKEVRRLGGSGGFVWNAEFLPAGLTVQAESDARDILYNLETGATVSQIMPDKQVWRFSRAFSADGRFMVLGSWDKSATIWEVATGRQVRRFEHQVQVNAVAMSPDGTVVASGGGEVNNPPELVIWDAASGEVVHRLDGFRGSINLLAISPDGRRLLSGGHHYEPGADSTVQGTSTWETILWDVRSGRKLRQFSQADTHGRALAFSPDGRWIATDDAKTTAILWDAETGAKVRTFSNPNSKENGADQALVFSPDGRLLVAIPFPFHENPFSTVWEVSTGKLLRTLRGHRRAPFFARFAPDGRHLLTLASDGMPILWDVSTGKQLATLISVGRGADWLALTPEGLFDGSPGARQQVMFRVGGGLNVVPVERFFQDFFRPGLVAELLRGRRPLPLGTIGAAVAPLVRITSPARGGEVNQRQATLEVEVTDRGGGIRGPWLVQNGATVLAPGEPRRVGQTVTRSFTVPLVEGENRFEVRAASQDGSWESEPAVVVLNFAQSVEPAALHLVAVGVSKHAEGSLDLKYAAADAQAISELFRRRGERLYGGDRLHVHLLLDGQATRANLKSALEKVAKAARPQDTLVLFLAGHGTMLGQRFYFIPHEFRRQAAELAEDIRAQGLAGDELDEAVSAVPALKRVLVYDTCHSGGALRGGVTARNPFAMRKVLEQMSKDQGAFVLAATAASDEAQEVADLGHGVLTYALLGAMGAVDQGPLRTRPLKPSNETGTVTVRDWFGFAQDEVPALTRTYFGQEQFVQYTGSGANFTLLAAEPGR